MARPILKVKKRPHRLAQAKSKGATWVVKNTLYQTPPAVVEEVDYSIYSELESLLLQKNYNPNTDIIVLPKEMDVEEEARTNKTEILAIIGPILYMKVKHPALVTVRPSFAISTRSRFY